MTDRTWRGIGMIPRQRLAAAPKYREYDAEQRFEVTDIHTDESPLCRSGGGRACRDSTNGAHLLRGRPLLRRRAQPPVEVVRRAGALAGDHRGAERVARRAQRAERRALVRLDQPLQHLAAAADRRLLRCRCRRPRTGARRRTSRYFSESRQPLCGIIPMPRQDRSTTSKTSSSISIARPGCPRGGPPAGRRSRARARPSSSWCTVRRMPSRMSSGSKPVTTIGTSNRSASGGVLRRAHHRAHVAGGEERLHPADRARS